MTLWRGLPASGARYGFAVLSALAALALWCGPAYASAGVHTTLVNDTSYPIRMEGTGDVGCWNSDAFASPYTTVAPGGSAALYSSIKTSGGSCDFTFGDGGTNAWIYLGLYFEQPDGVWTEPISAGQDNIDTSVFSSSYYAPKLWYNTNTQDVYFDWMPPDTVWFPASPTTGGTTGDGLFCINVSYPQGESSFYQTVTVAPAQSCASSSTATAARVPAALHAARQPVSSTGTGGPTAYAATSTGVFDLEQIFQGACELLDPSSQCSSVTDSSLWNLGNVSSDVSNVTAVNDPSTGYGWGSLDPAYLEFQNDTTNPGSESYSFSGNVGEEDSTTTTNGFTVGNAITFGIDGISPINDTANLELDFSSSSTVESGSYTSSGVSSTVNTSPDSTTYLYGFQGLANQAFDYTADLTVGDQNGTAEPLTSPVPAVFGYSPAQAQPCIGYLIGNAAVTGSLLALYQEALADGYSASDPNLNSQELAFLSAGASFGSSAAACPGFPSSSSASSPNFASGASFDGTGTASLAALGGGGESSWDSNLQGMMACAYSTAVTGASSDPDNPCFSSTTSSPNSPEARAAGPAQHPGAVIMAARHRRFARLVGPRRSVLMIGGRDDHDTLITGDGQFNVIRGGRDETLIARGRNDVLFGGPGRTRLSAGPGFDTLYAGSGDDVLSATAGHGLLKGGSGTDVFNLGAHARYTAVGGSGTSTFNVRGSLAQLQGGRGKNVFRLLGSGRIPNIVEPRYSRLGTVLSDRSLTVPVNIQVARVIGHGAVTLRGSGTTRELFGGAGRARLVAGPGDERLIGGSGNTTFVFSRAGRAIATGGSGSNWFQLPGVATYTTGGGAGARLGAGDQITNFDPARDHLILRAREFGRGLLNGRLTLRETRSPRATTHAPTLLFDVARGLLSFDPDGSGPLKRHVLVSLRHFRCQAAARPATGRYRVRRWEGVACLPLSSITVTK